MLATCRVLIAGESWVTHSIHQKGFDILSDIGSNTLLHPDTFERSKPLPNRLKLLRERVAGGGGLIMVGGYMTFMNAREAAKLCALLRPRVAVPVHYAYTAGALRDRLLLKYDGTPAEFAAEAARVAPATEVHILAPGEPLLLAGA